MAHIPKLQTAGAPLKTETAVFSKQKLAELAGDEANKVYDYVYDTPQRILPPKEVRLKLLAIRGIVVANAKAHPEWKWRQHKKHIQDNHPELAAMASSHPKMYDVASHPATDYAHEFAPMLMEIDMFQRVQDGSMTREEATLAITKRLQEHFLMDKDKTKEDTTPWGVSTRPG